MGQRKWGKRDYQKLSFRVRVNYNSNDIIQFFNGFFCKHRRQAEKNSCQNTPYRSPFEFEGAKKKKKYNHPSRIGFETQPISLYNQGMFRYTTITSIIYNILLLYFQIA